MAKPSASRSYWSVVVHYCLFAVLFIPGLLVGCGSDAKKEEPAELQDIKQEMRVSELWSRGIGSGYDGQYLFLQPVFTGNGIYAIDVEGELYSLDKSTGKVLWKHDLGESVSGGLGYDESALYYATFNGDLVALSLRSISVGSDSLKSSDADGAPVLESWRAPLSSEAIAPPQSNGRLVVVQTVDGRVAAFDKKSGKPAWVYQSNAPVLSLRGTATPLINDDVTVTGFANGELVQLDNASGIPFWQHSVAIPQGRTELERLVDIDGRVGFLDRMLYSASYQGNVQAVDLYSGQELWSKSASSYVDAGVDFSSVYLAASNGDVIALDRITRSEVWTQPALKYRRLTAPAVIGSVVAVGDFEGYLHILSKSDGRFVARIRVDSDGLRVPMHVEGNVVYIFGNSGQLAAYSVE
jgi:outer membrane protein assembly factor BamB